MSPVWEAEDLPVRVTLSAPADLEGLGARIERPVTRAIAARWRAARYEAGAWVVDLDEPVPPEPAGERPVPDPGYVVAWLTRDAEPPAYEAIVAYVPA
jgi:hypothetical protein